MMKRQNKEIAILKRKFGATKRKLDKVMRENGQEWSDIRTQMVPVERKFLQTWKKYIQDKKRMRNEFLRIGERLGELMVEETRANKEYMKISEPYVKDILKLREKIKKQKKVRRVAKLRKRH